MLRSWGLLGGIVVLAATLRFYGLANRSLWFDEVFSLLVAARPVGELVSLTAEDFHPPGHLLLLHTWLLLTGSGEVGARSLSAVFGLLTVMAAYALARHLFASAGPAMAAAVIVATSPLLVEYSQEARAYSLGSFLAVLSAHLLGRATRERGGGSWIGYAFVSAAGLLVHYYFALVLLATAVVFWSGRPDQRAVRHWLAAHFLVLALFAFWLPFFGEQVRAAQEDFPHKGVRAYGVVQTMKNLAVRYPFVGSLAELASWRGVVVGGGILAYGGAIALGLRRRGWAAMRLPCTLVVIPFVASLLISPWIALHRFFFFVIVAPFFCLMVAAGLQTVAAPRARALALIAIVTVNLVSVGYYFFGRESPKADVRGAATHIRSRYQEGDWVAHTSVQTFFPSRYYHGGKLREVLLASDPLPPYAGGRLLETAEVVDPQSLQAQAAHSSRVWLVIWSPTRGPRSLDPLPARARGPFADDWPLGWRATQEREFYWVKVYLLERGGGRTVLPRRPD